MRGTPFPFQGFTGGLNTFDSPYTVEQNETPDAINVVSTTRGSILKRNGSTTFASPPVEFTSLLGLRPASTAMCIAAGGTAIYKVDTGGTVTSLKTGLASGVPWEFVQAHTGARVALGPVYAMNGTDPPQAWDGAAGATVAWTSNPGAGFQDITGFNGKYLKWHSNRVWVAGFWSDPTAVIFSDLLDPTSFPTSNIVRFDSSDGQPITGLAKAGPYLLVFKERKTYVVYDGDTGANRRLDDSIGCVAHRSIAQSHEGTFFLSADRGVCVTDGSHINQLSIKVTPTIGAINPAKRQNAAGVFWNNHYYLSYASGTSTANNRTLDYDLALKSWWLHDLAANQWTVWEPASGLELHAAKSGSAVQAKCFVPNVYTDSGANYTGINGLGAYWRSAWIPFYFFIYRHRVPAPFVKKRIRQVFFDGVGHIQFYVWKNFASQGSLNQDINFNAGQVAYNSPSTGYSDPTVIYGGTAAVQSARAYALGVADVWAVSFGNSTSEFFQVDSFTMATQFRKS